MPWTKHCISLVQVQNKTLWTAPLWTYWAVWTTASCKVNSPNSTGFARERKSFARERKYLCEKTQKFCERTQTEEKYIFLPPQFFFHSPRIFPTTMSHKGLRSSVPSPLNALIISCFYAGLQGFPVAQMVEHGASNAKIMGSIPRESKSW